MEMEKEPLAVGDYTVHLNTELSMVEDGKMVDILMGDLGSFCHYCTIVATGIWSISRSILWAS